jgi:hypothetical protein
VDDAMAEAKLTKLELQIMEALWTGGASSIRQIQETFPERNRPAYTTVQTTEFKNGCGKFFAQDVFNGKRIFKRFVWTDMTTNSPHFEQSFSDDGGKTWEVNWITDPTRISDESDKAHRSEPHPRGPS